MGNIPVVSVPSEARRVIHLSEYITPKVLPAALPLVGWSLDQIEALRTRFLKGQHSSFSTLDEFCSIFDLERLPGTKTFNVFAHASVNGRFNVGIGETHVATTQQAFLATLLCSKLSTQETIEHMLRLFAPTKCTSISATELLALLHDLLNGLALLTGGHQLPEAVTSAVYDKFFSKFKLDLGGTVDAAAVSKHLKNCAHFCRLRSHFHDYSTDDSGLDIFGEHTFVEPFFGDATKLPRLTKPSGNRVATPVPPMRKKLPVAPTRRFTPRSIHNEEERIHLICSKAVVLDLHQTFCSCDSNKSGEIDVKEFVSHLSPKLRKYGNDWFQLLDLDRNGRVTFNELLLSMFPTLTTHQIKIINVWILQERHQMRLSKARSVVHQRLSSEDMTELREMFDIFDADHDGVLSQADVQATMGQLREVVTFNDLCNLVARERDATADKLTPIPIEMLQLRTKRDKRTPEPGITFVQFASLFGREGT
ncbi:hypothetical protein ACHHYP_07700 [Achlya hypogyna]|uniref:EF-hand domain-containing protein n=1 Tax=Achlya hypogyna TaxID=1202772 RepID=A0A1V9YR15_ACHHY|nr:hypothetical protein ACHHYP_07700 [Achlya hypogyna]